jgi:hypothetical protein
MHGKPLNTLLRVVDAGGDISARWKGSGPASAGPLLRRYAAAASIVPFGNRTASIA